MRKFAHLTLMVGATKRSGQKGGKAKGKKAEKKSDRGSSPLAKDKESSRATAVAAKAIGMDRRTSHGIAAMPDCGGTGEPIQGLAAS